MTVATMENVGNFVGGGDRTMGCGMKFIMSGEGSSSLTWRERNVYNNNFLRQR
jgi:hypothetical protein